MSMSAPSLPVLTEREREQVLREWNATGVDVPVTCAHQMFEEQVARTPDAPALVFQAVTLSFRQLNERANQLAHFLRARGIGPEVLVGVCLERSDALVIALLAIWKAGGAYVPLDPLLPTERLAFMLKDAAARVLLTDAEHGARFPAGGPELVLVDNDGPLIDREPRSNPTSSARPSNLAYVMYTSGSTGQPKGVMIPHDGLVNYLAWSKDTYAAGSGRAVPVHSSIAFDLTITALFTPLVAGGSVEMLRDEVGAQHLTGSLRRDRERSLVKITPAHLALLGEELGGDGVVARTKLLVIGGENLLAENLQLWRARAPGTRLVNEHGPTETVVGCCIHEVSDADPRNGAVPIGRPIANTQLYILDGSMNPLPPGVVGELYIGGAGVARGYLNRPALTAEKFVPDPFSGSGGRIYQTGDLARYRADGIIEYRGRVDSQVKVRGYRIELGEIETTLADLPDVKASAVVVREDALGEKQLVGYVVAKTDVRLTTDGLRRALGAWLPEYMVPARFVFLDALPLTQNGKVDRNALPEPTAERAAVVTEPRTPDEHKLLAIWRDVLGLKEIGIHDSFFELGGHSLQAIRAMARMKEVFDVDVSAEALFEAPSIAQLAALLGPAKWTPTWTCIVPIQTQGTKQPFFLVHAIGGNVFNYRLLSKHLGNDQPFYGLQARGMTGNDAPHDSVEAMAKDYIAEMRKVQPQGPYRIGGSSSGGVIAYEMAQQLAAVGERASRVVMLDTVLTGPMPSRITEALAGSEQRRLRVRFDHHLGGIFLRSPREVFEYVAGLVQAKRRGPGAQIAAAIKAKNQRLREVIESNRRALAAYAPRPYAGSVVMLVSGEEPDRTFYDRRLAWADLLTAGLNIRFMPGSHENMLDEPQVSGVATVIAGWLALPEDLS
jgi:amino acid adenylation domain-containing protein